MEKYTSFSKNYYPSEPECMEILDIYGTPENVKLHCKTVGKVANIIAKALNQKGLKINVPLVSAAGYLHDIARVHKVHEKVGAEYIESIGLKDVSEVMKNHTKHMINEEILLLNEEDILCIADRVVLESKYVGPQKRMEYIKSKAIMKYGQESEAQLDKIKDEFVKFVKDLEDFIGNEIMVLCQNLDENN